MTATTETRPVGADPRGGPIDAGVRIGHVHLKVADIERSLAIYCDVLGFKLTAR